MRALAREIRAALSDAYPLVLAVMGGAVVFAGQLLPLLQLSARFRLHPRLALRRRDARRAASSGASRRRDAVRRAARCWCSTTSSTAARRMAAIRDRLLELGAQSVLLRRAGGEDIGTRKSRSHADFVGLQIPDRFVFGCGMDAKGFWRNLPEIRAMKEAEPMLAIIGGSGLTQLANLEVTRRQVVRTPYGEPSGALTFGAHRRTRRRLPRAPRLRPHASRRTRSTTAPTSGR